MWENIHFNLSDLTFRDTHSLIADFKHILIIAKLRLTFFQCENFVKVLNF